MKIVLSIAGSDCSGGAGIQADIKTITAYKMYAMSVITALTAQNTTGVHSILEVSPKFVAEQLDMVFTDILPDAVKIGMVSNNEIINVIAEKLSEYKVRNIVLDPVMVSTSGRQLLKEGTVDTLVTKLIPQAKIITPNIPEAEILSGIKIMTKKDMIKAAVEISNLTAGYILMKGGHLFDCSDDLLYFNKEAIWYKQVHIDNPNTHGTGCTLSSAIACNLAVGKNISDSVEEAKDYITGAIKDGLDFGKGSGPINHCWRL